ncbi:methylenetetrahydrofolate reductase [NAD(P)H] [Austwickia sp. TVS 96-490-7B]|uniref:methylenetetrahydrofolate reductase [NAD(P)H] n=1 Tax=Austwickia sp. TVS 96-490-7B TaxID=2830843 RepID=UPI001C58F47C|nr:methylenetetrahydrofolate reductase [NAD(P)H] [Austwickia sp. TVS 96-490-7B]
MSRPSIPELLESAEPTFSFEFFPPKDDRAESVLWDAIRRLEPLSPAFVSVTYGAGGSTRDRTVRVTERIAHETTLRPMAHLTCVSSSKDELREVVGQYAAGGVHDVLALRGDPPGGPGASWTAHPEGLNHAEDLVRLIRSLGEFTVGVAAFPDTHPESGSLEADADVLVRKFEAGARFAVTQFVFDPDSYLRLRDLVARRGHTEPILPGLMPVTSFAQIRRMAELSGTALPSPVVARLAPLADDPPALRAEGVAVAIELARRLLTEGAPGLHFYTMNRSTATLQVYRDLVGAAEGSGLSATVTMGDPVRTSGGAIVLARRLVEAMRDQDWDQVEVMLAEQVVVDRPAMRSSWRGRADVVAHLRSIPGTPRVERVVNDAGRQVVCWVARDGGSDCVSRHDVMFLTLDRNGRIDSMVIFQEGMSRS